VKQKEKAKDKPQQTNLKTKLLKLVYLLWSTLDSIHLEIHDPTSYTAGCYPWGI
jgi:hypothetical protein